MKNYYEILGVSEGAEEIVIKAAYRALVQKYHPDKQSGEIRRMQEINEAYEILSHQDKKKEYDLSILKNKKTSKPSSKSEGEAFSLDDEWRKILEYFPDLQNITKELAKISGQLGKVYRTILIENREFDKRYEIAEQLELVFLKEKFGTDKMIIEFGKLLLVND
ncbi:MAG: DnaJ domain-containing protein [Bacteriovoracaceae bacterium]|nr:DnaJ domain-containing protein [Bacteriovoracaceae bacterium]